MRPFLLVLLIALLWPLQHNYAQPHPPAESALGLAVDGRPFIDDAAVKAAEGLAIWACNTPGGYVLDGYKIAFGLWSRHAISVVPPKAVCASAGALAWLGGWHRLVRGILMFHGMTPAVGDAYRWQQLETYLSWGVPINIAHKIVTLAPGAVWVPSASDLARLER